jgi:hypothetical protein
MRILPASAALMVASMLIAAPVFAQSSSKQKTDGDSPTTVGPGSAAYKQKSDGDSPTTVGPGSKAYKQKTQSMSHSWPSTPNGMAKQN